MKALLNEFILDLFHHKDNRILEKKLNLWREELQQEKIEIEQLKLKYIQDHENPRKDFETTAQTYLEQLATLKNNFITSTDLTKKANLYNWLKEVHTIPEILYTKKSNIYTYNK
jgi:hypothetical protein